MNQSTHSHSALVAEARAPDEVLKARDERRLVLAHIGQLNTERGVRIPNSPKPVLHVLAFFRRNILATGLRFNPAATIRGHSGPGSVQLFESPEHQSLAGAIQLQYGDNQFWSAGTETFTLSGGAVVTYAETVALAGDFFGVVSEPISDGADSAQQQQRFQNAFNTLDTASASYVNGILAVINRQSQQVQAAVGNYPNSADAYSQAYAQVDAGYAYIQAYNGATGGMDPSDPNNHNTTLLGQFIKLASTNWDHFGNHAVTAYQAGHAVALNQAFQAGLAGNQNLLLRAYILDAYACHFLSDLFAAGHLRTPRKAMYSQLDPFVSLCAQIMHDEDNYNGMWVSSVMQPDGWAAWGDTRLLDQVDSDNLNYARQALQASANEIYQAYAAGAVPSSYAAMQYTPNLAAVLANTPKNFWNPLFTVPNSSDEADGNLDAVALRVSPYDLRGPAQISVNVAANVIGQPVYYNLFLNLPTGGIHSAEGAPPKLIQNWAHKFAWQTPPSVVPATGGKPIPNVSALAAACIAPPLPPSLSNDPPSIGNLPVDSNGQLPSVASKNQLHIFYRSGTSTQVTHLLTDLENVPEFANPCSVRDDTSTWSTSGGLAAVSLGNSVVVVYPNSAGQMILNQLSAGEWAKPVALQGQDSRQAPFIGTPGGTPALATYSGNLYVAYRDANQVVQFAATYNGVWGSPTAVTIGGTKLTAGVNPSLVASGAWVYLIVGGAKSSSGNNIKIYRTPNSIAGINGASPPWNLFKNQLKNGSGTSITVNTYAQGFAYADTFLVIGTNSNNVIRTIAPLQNNTLDPIWKAVPVPINASGTANAQTTLRTAFLVNQAVPLLLYADSTATNTLTAITGKFTI